jgi:Mrp family chromosome partitioning ATPase
MLSETEPISPTKVPVEGGNLSILTAGSGHSNQINHTQIEKISKTLQNLKKHADILIIDAPPFFIADTQMLLVISDATLFVVNAGRTKLELVRSAITQLKRHNTRLLGIVMNRVPGKQAYYYKNIKDYPDSSSPLAESDQDLENEKGSSKSK